MKTFFASDLHYDKPRGRASTRQLAEFVAKEGTSDDVLVLGGDYADDDPTLVECLELFDAFRGRKLAVAGNHDIWVGEDATPGASRLRYERLSTLFEQSGFHPLEQRSTTIGGVGFVGAMGWYDYSLRDPFLGVPMQVYRDKSTPGASRPVWNDAYFANWGMSDPEVTDWQLERLEAQLGAVSEAESIIVCLHHVPSKNLLRPSFLPAFIRRRQVMPKKWLVLNTYLGSTRFEKLLGEYADRVAVAFCGHIHLGRDVVSSGVRFVSNGSSYRQKELLIWQDGELLRRQF